MITPKQDPERLALRAHPKPVVRLNRRMLAIVSAVIAAGILGISLWSLQPKSVTTRPAETQVNRAAQKVSPAEGLATLPRDYASLPKTTNKTPPAVPQLGSPLGELGRPVLKAEQAAGLEPLEAQYSYQSNAVEDNERVDRLRRVQESDAAAKAQVFFQLSRRDSGQTKTATQQTPSTAESAFDQAMKLIPTAMTAGEAAQTEEGGTQNGQSAKRAFMTQATESTTDGSGTLQTLRSPYQLIAGAVIPAALVTGINSDLPGQIIATVTENLYDTVTGHYLLVPQGSRLLGQYDSQVAYGQRRVLLVWTRLLLPDGASLVLDRLPGVDAAGQAGLEDQVNWHWARIFEGAALSTLIGVGAELAAPQSNNNTVVTAGRESLQSTITEVGQQITRRNLNLQPTLTVRPGFPVRVIVNKDLTLRPFAADARSLYSRTP